MTTIHRVPEEILLNIFQQLDKSDLKRCQHVCRSWYPTAHCLLLKNILLTVLDIEQFIKSIDSNPKESYLKAVKDIYITSSNRKPETFRLSKEVIQKLFCRFSNLMSVKILDDKIKYDEFNDDICGTILRSCPHINTFEVAIAKDDQEYYSDTLYKLRLLLTRMDISEINFTSRPESPIEYLTSFPQLQEIQLIPGHLDNFQKLLPVIMQLSRVEFIQFDRLVADTDEFAEKFLTQITKDKQEWLLKNLSNVTRLYARYQGTFDVNSTKFICKYLNKLDDFMHFSFENHDLTEEQKTLLCHDIIDLACSATNNANIRLNNIKPTDLVQILPVVVRKFFRSVHQNKVVELSITGNGPSYIFVESYKILSLRKITMRLLSLNEFTTNIFRCASPISHVDKFTLSFDGSEEHVTINILDDIFETMPSMKKVVLDVPTSYTVSKQEQIRTYPLVEKLTIRANLNNQCQELLDHYNTKFPNVHWLNLYYYYGTWCKERCEFQFNLKNFTLERLVLDMSTLVGMGTKYCGYHGKAMFIVIQVNQQLYKLSLDRLPKTTLILEKDLESFILGKNYFRLYIIISDLKQLDYYYDYSVCGPTSLYLNIDHLRLYPRSTVFNNTNQ